MKVLIRFKFNTRSHLQRCRPGGSHDRLFFHEAFSPADTSSEYAVLSNVDKGCRPCWKVFIHSSGGIVSLCGGGGGAGGEAIDCTEEFGECQRGLWWCFDSLNLKGQGKPQASSAAQWYSAQALTAAAVASLLASLLSYTKWGKSDFWHVILFLSFQFHVRLESIFFHCRANM